MTKPTTITISLSLSQVLANGEGHLKDVPKEEDVEITTSVRVEPVDDQPGRFSLGETVSLYGVVRLLSRGDIIETRHVEGPEYVLTTIVKREDR